MQVPVLRLPALAGQLRRDYASLIVEEPGARAYLGASLIDDVGIAVSGWPSALMMTNLATTQRARASLMLPTLLCFLISTLVSGPLADWSLRTMRGGLARWRWTVVLTGRAIETTLLGVIVVRLSMWPPTIATVLPYVMVTAFMKAALRPTRMAFSVDMLREDLRGRETTTMPGFGIGVWLTRLLAEAHGGTFRLILREGSGTRAVVELPRHDDAGVTLGR